MPVGLSCSLLTVTRWLVSGLSLQCWVSYQPGYPAAGAAGRRMLPPATTIRGAEEGCETRRRRRRARRSVTTLQLGFLPRLSRDCDIVLVFAAAVAGDCLAYDGGRVRTGGNTAHHKPDDSH